MTHFPPERQGVCVGVCVTGPERPATRSDLQWGRRGRRREAEQRVHLQRRVLHGRSGSAINHRRTEGGTKLDRWRRGGEKEVKE